VTTELTLSVTSLSEFDLAATTVAEAGLGKLPCIEILWDNYCHLDPYALVEFLDRFSDRRSLHVMWSRFLERDEVALECYLRRLREHVRVLAPFAVSDHLCRFVADDVHLLIPQEHDYTNLDHVCERVARYQDAIGQPLLIENYASTQLTATRQIEFLEQLIARTGCGILFDVSNAVVGECNQLGSVDCWMQWLADREVRVHVGSYAYNANSGLYHDTHNADVCPRTEQYLAELATRARVMSVCYERDYNKVVAAMANDLRRIAKAVQA
jgi:uncharacterized protein